jgi:4-carboxymuconolactone decarboxylase
MSDEVSVAGDPNASAKSSAFWPDRMPPLDPERMTEAQQRAAAELSAGPRGGVRGPFVPLLRSPELMSRLQRVGEYLRYHGALEPRISEFVVLIVSRQWTQQFEWAVHYPIALKAGLKREIATAIADGRRPAGMSEDEAIAYDVCDELFRTRGVSETTYRRAVGTFGEQGIIDLLGLVGYFVTVSIVMNVAHTPRPDDAVVPLADFPL